MTKQDLLKYAGKKTFGKNNALLTNGVIVGFDPNDNYERLVARFENGDVSGEGWSISAWEITFFTEKEEEIYKSGKGCYLFAKIDNVIMDEQKELDLTEILKGCEGVELWSDIFGKCKLESLDCDEDYKIIVLVLNSVSYENKYEQFTKYGRFYDCYPNGKCILWPSETNRDWSTFKKPLKADDFVVACDIIGCGLIDAYKNIDDSDWKYVIPFEKYNPTLTDEELNKLSIV